MRLKHIVFGLLFLCVAKISGSFAEPLIRGYFIEKLPEKATSKALSADKGLVLAHVFNTENATILPGNYKIGVEIIDKLGKKKTYALAPTDTVEKGMMKTFRLAVPMNEIDKDTGKFRVFTKVGEKVQWSDTCFFSTARHVNMQEKITTLYEEAPPLGSSTPFNTLAIKPLAPVFQKTQLDSILKDEKISDNQKSKTALAPVNTPKVDTKTIIENNKKNLPKPTVIPIKTPETTGLVAKMDVKKAEPKQIEMQIVNKPIKIDPNEFKRLKTIDEELIIYVIKEGDTLKSIASKYYGNPSKERAIADLNFIELTSLIKVGEEIIVDVRPLNKMKQS